MPGDATRSCRFLGSPPGSCGTSVSASSGVVRPAPLDCPGRGASGVVDTGAGSGEGVRPASARRIGRRGRVPGSGPVRALAPDRTRPIGIRPRRPPMPRAAPTAAAIASATPNDNATQHTSRGDQSRATPNRPSRSAPRRSDAPAPALAPTSPLLPAAFFIRSYSLLSHASMTSSSSAVAAADRSPAVGGHRYVTTRVRASPTFRPASWTDPSRSSYPRRRSRIPIPSGSVARSCRGSPSGPAPTCSMGPPGAWQRGREQTGCCRPPARSPEWRSDSCTRTSSAGSACQPAS